MNNPKYLVVLSLDALSTEDLLYAKDLKGFKTLVENGSTIKKVETIYPSLTYPVHATIVTGKYPNNHGIIANKILDEKNHDKEWYWYRKYICGDTLYDAARRNGLKTAALLWPVTAGAKINYNLPEIWSTKNDEKDIFKLLRSGSKAYMIDLQLRFGKLRRGIKQPYLDDFVCACTRYTIKSKKPNLLLVHFIDLDTQKHEHGIDSTQAKEAIRRIDKRIQEIIFTLKESKIYDETAIVAFGDHSQLNANIKVKPNVIFYEHGLISTNEKGEIINNDAYFSSCDGSGYVYIKDNKNILKVRDILMDLKNEGIIEEVLSTEEASEIGANSNCSFMIEASKGYSFSDEILGDYKEEFLESTGQHGYNSKKENYTSAFIASGCGIKKGVTLEKGHVINYAKTFSSLLGFEMKEANGCVIKEILDI